MLKNHINIFLQVYTNTFSTFDQNKSHFNYFLSDRILSANREQHFFGRNFIK